MLLLSPQLHRQRLNLDQLEFLQEYPFLKAAIEDLGEAHLAAAHEQPNRRHVVCLMFDCLEFVLYEIMLLHEQDIYKTGQNTIGFDNALRACQDLGVETPFIGTVREIQKTRGDAKHHAQVPTDATYQRLIRNFEIVISRLVHEQFESVLADAISALPLQSHRVALYESYRRQRNHNWEQAYRFALGALIRKHNEIFGSRSGRPFRLESAHQNLLATLEGEISATSYDVAPTSAIRALNELPQAVRLAAEAADWETAANLVASAYSTIDKLVPGIFDIDQAIRLTNKLYVPKGFRYGKPMAWAKVWGHPGTDEEALTSAIAEFLKANPDVVKKFGQPQYAEDEDRYWRWWELAIFDGERWHTFHLETTYEVALETGLDSSRDRAVSGELLRLILDEFRAAA